MKTNKKVKPPNSLRAHLSLEAIVDVKLRSVENCHQAVLCYPVLWSPNALESWQLGQQWMRRPPLPSFPPSPLQTSVASASQILASPLGAIIWEPRLPLSQNNQCPTNPARHSRKGQPMWGLQRTPVLIPQETADALLQTLPPTWPLAQTRGSLSTPDAASSVLRKLLLLCWFGHGLSQLRRLKMFSSECAGKYSLIVCIIKTSEQ